MESRLIIFSLLVLAAVMAKVLRLRAYGILKPLPILFILLLAYLSGKHLEPLWLMAILFGLAGDLFLLWRQGFIPGLLSFLFGHIFYIYAFGAKSVASYSSLSVFTTGIIALMAFFYFARHLIQSRQKKYILPLFFYIGVSALLVVAALQAPLVYTGAIGAIFFVFSDFLLAFNKFVRPSWYVQAGVSLTYFAAQWLLALHFAAI